MALREIERVTVLLAVSDDDEGNSLERILRNSRWSVHPVSTLRDATIVLQEGTIGVVVSGLRFPFRGHMGISDPRMPTPDAGAPGDRYGPAR